MFVAVASAGFAIHVGTDVFVVVDVKGIVEASGVVGMFPPLAKGGLCY